MNIWDYSDPLYLQIEKFFEELWRITIQQQNSDQLHIGNKIESQLWYLCLNSCAVVSSFRDYDVYLKTLW